jgi:hypothetical protein
MDLVLPLALHLPIHWQSLQKYLRIVLHLARTLKLQLLALHLAQQLL